MRILRLGAVSAIGLSALLLVSGSGARAAQLVEPPQVSSKDGVAQFTLTAVQNAKTGLPTFSFDGYLVPPTIRVNPGDHIKIRYINDLPTPVGQPFSNMTNLHFHGLKTSPKAPGDDVIDTMLMPGQTYDYDVTIPKDESPGLYWYHPHAHGESNRQVSGGMSGLIIINGIEKYYPQVAGLKEQLLILRDSYSAGYPVPAVRRRSVRVAPFVAATPAPICSGAGSENLELNKDFRPTISIMPGETQFWRFANNSANSFVDLQVDGATLAVIARDGEPIIYRDGSKGSGVLYHHYLVPPAGRVEFLVTGPKNAGAAFRSLCVNTGPVGDIMPERILAYIDPTKSGGFPVEAGSSDIVAHKRAIDIRAVPINANKTIVLTEDKPDGLYYINGKTYNPTAPTQYFAKAGTVEKWTILNETQEVHAFHIHQIHFMVVDPANSSNPENFLDTVLVPFETPGPNKTMIPGKVTLLMDFTDPIIEGTFVFHCHILEHEDAGMMQKITVLP